MPDAAVGADDVVGDVARIDTLGAVAEADELAVVRVDLGMRGERGAAHAAAEVPFAAGRERDRVQRHGQAVFLEGEQLAGMEHHVGVGGAAAVALHRRLVRVGVAVGAVQRLAGGALELELLGAHVAVLEVHPAPVEAELRHRAIAVEVDVVAELRRVLRIRRGAVEDAVHVGRHRAVDLQVVDVELEAARRGVAGVGRIVGKPLHGEPWWLMA